VIRAFIGIAIDPETIKKISAAIAELTPRIDAVRWVAPTNFHVTLKFLGEVEETKLQLIAQALRRDLSPFPRFSINAKGLGVFPTARRPRILWVGLVGNGLVALAAKVETALLPLGIAPEKRAFEPHLTVGRWRQLSMVKKNLADELERWKDFEFGPSKVDEVILIQSVLKPEGATYKYLATVPLAREGHG
jgi:2'-5' RNA ligase